MTPAEAKMIAAREITFDEYVVLRELGEEAHTMFECPWCEGPNNWIYDMEIDGHLRAVHPDVQIMNPEAR